MLTLLLHQCWEYVSQISFYSLLLVSPQHTGKSFSLTQMHRNLFIGRSSAAGLLPQAEAPWSPWQPCYSDGQHRVRVSWAAALSHRSPALIRQRAGITATIVLSFNCPSLSQACLFVKRASGCFFQCLVALFVPLVWESVNQRDPRGPERLMLQSICQKPV